MHEIGIMKDVLETAIGVAEKHGGSKISTITLRVGVLSGLIPYYCRSMFEFIAKGTIAEECELKIEEEPAVFKCLKCGKLTSYDTISADYCCNICGSEELRLIEGYKAQIVSVGIV